VKLLLCESHVSKPLYRQGSQMYKTKIQLSSRLEWCDGPLCSGACTAFRHCSVYVLNCSMQSYRCVRTMIMVRINKTQFAKPEQVIARLLPCILPIC